MTPNRNLFIIIFSILSISLFAQPDADKPIFNKDQVILDDLIVDGSTCVGFDCTNGESFGFDTIRLKENNLRIKFQDTSTSASFPTNDWQITINDTSNGGQNKFSIDDIDGGRTPFTIEAGAPSHSLYVDDGGRVGFGTSTPVADLHVKSGNTPTLRLEQDGSSGFTPQTWDVAGNEANFFIRDATNGSTLPFRIRPGAPESSINIAGDGDVGIGTSSPSSSLHVRRTDGTAQLHVEEANGTSSGRVLLTLTNTGSTRLAFDNTNDTEDWLMLSQDDGSFATRRTGSSDIQMELETNGDLKIGGSLTSNTIMSPSDRKLKKNVAKYVKGLDVILNLNPITYNYNGLSSTETTTKHVGIFAQELQKIAPELVKEYSHFVEEQETGQMVLEDNYLKVNQLGLIYVMANAIKEQNELIENKNEQLEDLSKEIELMKESLSEINQNIEQLNLSNTVISSKEEKRNFLISQNLPNPYRDQSDIEIEMNGSFSQASVNFVDAQGQLIATHQINSQGKSTLNLNKFNLPSGVIAYTLVVDGAVISSKRLIKK